MASLINQYAIITGRFQPFHLGHLDFVRSTVAKVSGNIVIGIVVQAFGGGSTELNEFQRAADIKNDSRRNPFTYWERFVMIKRTLELELGNNFSDLQIIPFPRPEKMWDLAKNFLPPNRVWPIPKDDSFDSLKADFFSSMGEHVIELDAKTRIHGTDIRRKIANGEDWVQFIPRTTVELLQEIDGIKRLEAVARFENGGL